MRTPKNQLAMAELRFSYRPLPNPVKITSAHDAELFFRSIWNSELLNIQEQFYVLYLNVANEVVCWRCLHTGGISHSPIDTRLLFSLALGCLATSIVVAHNHPSGNLMPSDADLKLTDEIAQAGRLLNIPLADHLILSANSRYSFVEAEHRF